MEVSYGEFTSQSEYVGSGVLFTIESSSYPCSEVLVPYEDIASLIAYLQEAERHGLAEHESE